MLALLIGSIAAACDLGGGTIPTLANTCELTPFELLGEITNTWIADVIPGKEYRVSVDAVVTSHPINHLFLGVADYDRNPLDHEEPKLNSNQIFVNFTAPTEGKVVIYFSSKIGEGNDNLGAFTIKLCEQGA